MKNISLEESDIVSQVSEGLGVEFAYCIKMDDQKK